MTELEYLRAQVQMKRNFLEKRVGDNDRIQGRINAYNDVLHMIDGLQELVHDNPKPATRPDNINQI